MEIVRFDAEDVIAASTPSLPVYSIHVNNMNMGGDTWYTILNGDGAKAFSDWSSHPNHQSSADTMMYTFFVTGDWKHSGVANSSLAREGTYTYIWYGSGYGIGNVTFNTQGQPWSYYLDNGIALPSGQ